MNTPKKHHYVPKLLLKSFTLDGGDDDRLWAFDQRRRSQWRSTPRKSACEANFNTIDRGPGIDPTQVEKDFGAFESDAASALRNILTAKRLPAADSRDFDLLINFVALLVSRVPAIREKITQFVDEVRAKEDFAREWLRQSGNAVAEAPAEAIDRTWLVGNTIFSVQTLVPHLAQRKWSLWFVENDGPDLICSDNPVALTWTVAHTGPYPPGFGVPNTLVSCPLTRRTLLVGSYEGQRDAAPLDERAVATANSLTASNANQLYSAAEDFVWLMSDGRIGKKADLMNALRPVSTDDRAT
ncbi:MAG TPA: DUF4238 domain-containing protein [Pirellulales bacterium]